jgi:hypothetical protein
MTTVITGEDIDKFRLLAIKSALRLECVGMKGKFSASKLAREILTKAGVKPSRSKQDLLVQYTNHINTILEN